MNINHLIEVLLDTDDKRNAYRQEADFYHGINLLSRMLPRFVDLMREESAETEQRRREAIRLAETGPLTPNLWIKP